MWGWMNKNDNGAGNEDDKRSKGLVKRFEALQEPFLDDLTSNMVEKYLVKLDYNGYGKYAGVVMFAASFVTLRRFGVRRIYNERYFPKANNRSSKFTQWTAESGQVPPNIKAPGKLALQLMGAGIFLVEFLSSLIVAREVELGYADALVKLWIRPLYPDRCDAACDVYCKTIVDEMDRLGEQDDISARLLKEPQQFRLKYFVDHANLCRKRLEYQEWVRQVTGLPANSPVAIPEPCVPLHRDFQPVSGSSNNSSSASSSHDLKQRPEGNLCAADPNWATDLVKDQEEGDDGNDEEGGCG